MVFSPKQLISSQIKPYESHPEACILSCYYNPLRFQSRRSNLDVFLTQLKRSTINYLIVECAFGTDEFELEPQLRLWQVRSRDVLWQKERLLNLAEKLLPPNIKYVIWLDADVLFTNSNWLIYSVEVLQNQTICQLFSKCTRLLPNQTEPDENNTEIWPSFGYVWNNDREKALSSNFDVHGHTGFAWSARRSVFSQIGLYDRAVAGTADHLMAHAAVGQIKHNCLEKAFLNLATKAHFWNWAEKFLDITGGKLGCVSGELWHLWHGEIKNRRYLERTRELSGLGFSPLTSLVTNKSGLYEFADTRDDLRIWMRNYFRQRLEDQMNSEITDV